MTTDQGITALVINPSENMIKNNINFTSGFSRSYSEIKSVRLKKKCYRGSSWGTDSEAALGRTEGRSLQQDRQLDGTCRVEVLSQAPTIP